jgi:hypothetical protein
MSANGAFSTTLDFEFFAGGYTTLTGEASVSIEPSLVSYARVPITGTLDDFNLNFSFTGRITPPIIQASAEDLSFGFTSSSFIEFGVQRYAKAEYGSLVIPFTQSAQGYNLTHAYLNKTLSFTLNTKIYVFSLGESAGTYGFNLESTALNVSTRAYSRDGANYCTFNGVNFNGVTINKQSNSVRIIDNGIRQAEVLQK